MYHEVVIIRLEKLSLKLKCAIALKTYIAINFYFIFDKNVLSSICLMPYLFFFTH